MASTDGSMIAETDRSESVVLDAKSTPKDPFHGRKAFAKKLTHFAVHHFDCPKIEDKTRLDHFIAYAVHRTRFPDEIVFAGLLLLHRLRMRYPAATATSGHRLFIGAYAIASKIFVDEAYTNKSWCEVASNLFALNDFNMLERQLCAYLDWDFIIDKDVLSAFTAHVHVNFSKVSAFSPNGITPFSESGIPQISTQFELALPRIPSPDYSITYISPPAEGTKSADDAYEFAASPSPSVSWLQMASSQFVAVPYTDLGTYSLARSLPTLNSYELAGAMQDTNYDDALLPEMYWDVSVDHTMLPYPHSGPSVYTYLPQSY